MIPTITSTMILIVIQTMKPMLIKTQRKVTVQGRWVLLGPKLSRLVLLAFFCKLADECDEGNDDSDDDDDKFLWGSLKNTFFSTRS